LNRLGSCVTSAFSTVNGSITLQLPKSADTKLHAETINGKVSSNLALIGAKRSSKRIAGRLGNGASLLKAKTVNGSIQLKRAADL
jgi:DUF4097 and DUF4098 domain-containing protein YvlB